MSKHNETAFSFFKGCVLKFINLVVCVTLGLVGVVCLNTGMEWLGLPLIGACFLSFCGLFS
jgi:hypothetical protein